MHTNFHHQRNKEDRRQTSSSSREKGNRLESQAHPGYGIGVGFGIIVGSAAMLYFIDDVARYFIILFGFTLGVLFTLFRYQYFDKRPRSSERRRKKHLSAPTPVIPEINDEFRPRGSAEWFITDPAPNSPVLSNITVVGPDIDPSLSPVEREVHVLRTGASFADDERRRCEEERKWAVYQGNIARASQMKSEVKRYIALMRNFNREAELKEMEGWLVLGYTYMSNLADGEDISVY